MGQGRKSERGRVAHYSPIFRRGQDCVGGGTCQRSRPFYGVVKPELVRRDWNGRFETLPRRNQCQGALVQARGILLRVEIHGKSGSGNGVSLSGAFLGRGESEEHSDGQAGGGGLQRQAGGTTDAFHAALRPFSDGEEIPVQPVVNELRVWGGFLGGAATGIARTRGE